MKTILLTGAIAIVAVTWPSEAPSAAPVPAGTMAAADACGNLTASSLEGYRNLVGKALAAARQDAIQNGTNGAYKVAATNSRDLLQRTYDRATQMVEFNRTQGNKNPNVTIYPEAGTFKTYLQTMLEWMPQAAHWATISAAYHRSTLAIEAFDGTIAAMTRGSQLMGDAGRCYTAYYMAGGRP